MPKKGHTEEQIVGVLRQVEAGAARWGSVNSSPKRCGVGKLEKSLLQPRKSNAVFWLSVKWRSGVLR